MSRFVKQPGKLYFVLLLAFMASACGKDSGQPTKTPLAGDPQRGKSIYLANCAACHNNDPSKDGSIGPAIKGSSRELIEARVLGAAYPPGYKPKRKTAAMPPYPLLKSTIPDLAAFLANPDPRKGLGQ